MKKIHMSCEIDPKGFFIGYQNSALQAACDTSIARVTGCVYPREGYRTATPLLIPGSTGLRRSALFCARKHILDVALPKFYKIQHICGSPPLQSIWSLSCDHGLDHASECENNNNNNHNNNSNTCLIRLKHRCFII